METVLAAFIIIFVVLFAALTLSHAFVSSQDTLRVAWEVMEARMDEQARTSLSPVSARAINGGTEILFTLRNNGTIKLADFDEWDVIVQYYDGGSPADYTIAWLPYTASRPALNEWTVAEIYLDAETAEAEAYEPNVLNPGEEAIIQVKVSPAIGAATPVQTMLSTGNGVGVSAVFIRNTPPVLTTNMALNIANNGTDTVDSARLAATDIDNAPADLIYSVIVPPTQGTLSMPATFSQADLDNNLVSYTHTGSGPDNFQFTISDGDDVIGAYTFNITISMPPVLASNAGLNVTSGGTGVINGGLLETSDVDNLPAELVYTVTDAPTQGTLSLGASFTQQDIDDGLLSYMHTGAVGGDSFQFTATDGESIIGPYTFNIAIS